MSYLEDQAKIQEIPFTSRWPLVARFRSAWNGVAARWYVLGMFNQQNEFNIDLAREVVRQSARLADQDRELVALTKTVAELELQLKQLKGYVKGLDIDG